MTTKLFQNKSLHPQIHVKDVVQMTVAKGRRRPLGTMIAYGFGSEQLTADIEIVRNLNAEVVEIFPNWRDFPDPIALKALISNSGLAIHSAHGCWGGQSISAQRVDLGSTDPVVQAESLDDIKRCIEWLELAGGTCLVVHPGGLSRPEESDQRLAALRAALLQLSDFSEGSGVRLCVENMPPGVHPGSRMDDLANLVAEIDRPNVAVALDTGHAHISHDVVEETLDAGRWLATTHVHDNCGRKDTHLAPGEGTLDWNAWARALDVIAYEGPIMLECIRHFRSFPQSISDALIQRLDLLTGASPRQL